MERIKELVEAALRSLEKLLSEDTFEHVGERWCLWSGARAKLFLTAREASALGERDELRKHVAHLTAHALSRVEIENLTRDMVKAAKQSSKILLAVSVTPDDIRRCQVAWRQANVHATLLPEIQDPHPLIIENWRQHLTENNDDFPPEEVAKLIRRYALAADGEAVEKFIGHVNRIDEDGAICRIQEQDDENTGEVITCFHPDKLSFWGIDCDDSFTMEFVKRGDGVVVRFALIPPRIPTAEEDPADIEAKAAALTT